MEVEIEKIRNETVPSFSSLVETFDKAMNKMPMGIMSEEHMITLRNCWTQLKDRYQKMETQTGSNSSARDLRMGAQTGSNSSARDDKLPKIVGFGGLVVTAAVHFGLSAAIPKFQGPKQRVTLCMLNLVISALSFASAATIACIPLFNREAKNLREVWKQSLQENGKYRSMIRVAAHLVIFVARVAILIYTAVVKNKMRVPNFDLSCVPGVADCWSVYREFFKKKSQANVADLESEHPSAATTTPHHSAALEDQATAPGDQGHQATAPGDQGDDAAGASGADSGDQGAVADLESDSVQHPSAATTTQHHSAALEDQASGAAPGDQGHQASGAAPGDQGDDAAGASGADSGDQGAVAGPHTDG